MRETGNKKDDRMPEGRAGRKNVAASHRGRQHRNHSGRLGTGGGRRRCVDHCHAQLTTGAQNKRLCRAPARQALTVIPARGGALLNGVLFAKPWDAELSDVLGEGYD
jgi:hypothetical protein